MAKQMATNTRGTIKVKMALVAILCLPVVSQASGSFMFGGKSQQASPTLTLGPALAALPQPSPRPSTVKLGNDTNQMVSTSKIFLRSAPGEHGRKLGLIEIGTYLDPTGRERNGWSEVEVRGRKGWVNDDHITEGTYCAEGRCQNAGGFTAMVESLTEVVRDTVRGGKRTISYADRLQRHLRAGYGAGKNKCWRAVHNVLKAAGLIRSPLTQNSAKNALLDLRKDGFRHDASACNTPGVVRVYGSTSVRVAARSRTAGDIHGHIEILGTDGRYHHFTKSSNSIQARFGSARRPLKYCLVKD